MPYFFRYDFYPLGVHPQLMTGRRDDHESYLVGGWPTPLKNMTVSWDYCSQLNGNNKCSKPPTRVVYFIHLYTDISYIIVYHISPNPREFAQLCIVPRNVSEFWEVVLVPWCRRRPAGLGFLDRFGPACRISCNQPPPHAPWAGIAEKKLEVFSKVASSSHMVRGVIHGFSHCSGGGVTTGYSTPTKTSMFNCKIHISARFRPLENDRQTIQIAKWDHWPINTEPHWTHNHQFMRTKSKKTMVSSMATQNNHEARTLKLSCGMSMSQNVKFSLACFRCSSPDGEVAADGIPWIHFRDEKLGTSPWLVVQ